MNNRVLHTTYIMTLTGYPIVDLSPHSQCLHGREKFMDLKGALR